MAVPDVHQFECWPQDSDFPAPQVSDGLNGVIQNVRRTFAIFVSVDQNSILQAVVRSIGSRAGNKVMSYQQNRRAEASAYYLT